MKIMRLGSLLLTRASALLLLILILIGFGLAIPETFLTATTFRITAEQVTLPVILSFAVLIPLLANEFDISVGAMAALSSCLVAFMSVHTDLNIIVICVLAMAACLIVGAITGFLVVKVGISSFIATLAMSTVLAAIALLISGNVQIVGEFSEAFTSAGKGRIFGIPITFFYVAFLAILLWYIVERTPVGRRLRATGINVEAAKLAGVRTGTVVWVSLITSAGLAGLGGIIYTMQVTTFSNSFGAPLLFPAFASVFLGASQFYSRPNVWGTVLAAYTVAIGIQGIQLAFSSSIYWISPMLNGLALIFAVGIAQLRPVSRSPVDLPPDSLDQTARSRTSSDASASSSGTVP